VDRYQRLLSTVFIDGQDVNLAMIEVGLAEVYRGPESGNPYTPQYQAAEAAARASKKGMWVLGAQYESPRAYRQRVGISEPAPSASESERDR
jgi:endonuclease YncB( thermonuclease family)